MEMVLSDIITQWIKNNSLVLNHRWEGKTLTLRELASGKSLTLDTSRITQYRLTPHPQGFKDYLNLAFDDGREIVLCHAGIAFSPSFAATGLLPDAPQVTCFSDYYTLSRQLDTLMTDANRRQDTLLLFNILISILDGARLAGFNVDQEEETLDSRLTQFEKEFGRISS